MARNIRKSKVKKMRPIFFVFCEGETEVAYVNYLKSKYRLPVQVIPRKSDSNISCRYIENCKKEYLTTGSDKTFLMYDLDVEGILDRLSCIPEVVLLVSNPCVELWFLLHREDCRTEMDSKICIRKYESVSLGYKKGRLSVFDMQLFDKGEDYAIERAKKMVAPDNPSTTVYKLVEALREERL